MGDKPTQAAFTIEQANALVGRVVLKNGINYTVGSCEWPSGEVHVWDPTTWNLLVFVSVETFHQWAYGDPVSSGYEAPPNEVDSGYSPPRATTAGGTYEHNTSDGKWEWTPTPGTKGLDTGEIHRAPLLERMRELERQLAVELAAHEATRRAMVLAAIPLEVLHATEADGKALCQEVKDEIAVAVGAIRAALPNTPQEGPIP